MQLIIADKNNLRDKLIRTKSKVSYWFLDENGFIAKEEPITKLILDVNSEASCGCNLSSLATTVTLNSSGSLVNSIGSFGISPSVNTIEVNSSRVRALENEVAELREQIERMLNER